MLKKTFLMVVLLLTAVAFAYAGSGPDIHEGLWEITVDFEMPGMPIKMPPSTYTQCIKKNEAIPHNDQPGQQCVQKNVKVKGGTVSWTMECTNQGGKMVGKGVITYHKEEMDGQMTLVMLLEERFNHITGVWIILRAL
jgi:hypothetical protein